MITTRYDLNVAINALALEHQVLFLHSSIRSFGHLEGGADTLINAFLDAGCTIIAPTFNYDTLTTPPSGWNYRQNGHRGPWQFHPVIPFDPDENRLEPDMGAIARAVLNHPKRVRSSHPVSSFAGIGPKAEEILAHQSCMNIYGLYTCQAAKYAKVLTVGVDLTSVTPIHCAEQMAGRRLLRRWARTKAEGDVEILVGSCSEGFYHLERALHPIANRVKAGQSLWTSYTLSVLLDICRDTIKQNPSITHCDDIHCPRCEDMLKGGPIQLDEAVTG